MSRQNIEIFVSWAKENNSHLADITIMSTAQERN